MGVMSIFWNLKTWLELYTYVCKYLLIHLIFYRAFATSFTPIYSMILFIWTCNFGCGICCWQCICVKYPIDNGTISRMIVTHTSNSRAVSCTNDLMSFICCANTAFVSWAHNVSVILIRFVSEQNRILVEFDIRMEKYLWIWALEDNDVSCVFELTGNIRCIIP